MKVIPANKKQIDAIAKILVEGYFDSLKEAKELVKSSLKECLVAVENNEVIGVLIYHSNYTHYANYIEDLAVSVKHRREGVASQLLKKFIKISKSRAFVLSSAKASNKASVKMHLKFGFKKIGRVPGLHYGEDDIIFGYRIH